MKYVQQLLKAKGNDVWTISQDRSVYEALELMAQKPHLRKRFPHRTTRALYHLQRTIAVF